MIDCETCGGCPRCEIDTDIDECVDCLEVKEITPDCEDHGDPYCQECWDRVVEVWADMDRADRYTRGAEGGWCDL